MKLPDWIKKNVPAFKRGAWADKVSEELYVVGPCRTCTSYSEIVHSKALHPGYCNLKGERDIPANYGCRYFDGEEDSEC